MKLMKFLLLFLLLMPASFSVDQTVAAQEAPAGAARLMTEDRDDEAREDWKTAEQDYLKLVQQFPSWAEVLVNLSVGYNHEGQSDKAIEVLKRALELKPGLFEANLNLGLTYFRTAQYGDAAGTLRRAVAIAPTNLQARELLALSQIALESYQDAAGQLEVLYTQNHRDPTILLALGQCYLRLKTYEKAVSRLQELVSISPDSAQAHFLLGEALDNASESERAMVELKR